MYQDDYFNPVDPNDYDEDVHVNKIFEKTKLMDRGYNIIYRKNQRKDGTIYNKKIEIYTSSGIGNRIRDAQTGEYYPNLVGSLDENLFFKVILPTGECQSANGSSTLFFISPQQYVNHLNCDNISSEMIHKWENRRDARLAELKLKTKSKIGLVEVK
jgi:hypothetical protein